MWKGEQAPVAATAETVTPPMPAAAMLADIARLALIIADQVRWPGPAAREKGWALGFLDSCGEIEPPVRRLRRSRPCRPLRVVPGAPVDTAARAFATRSGIDATDAVAQGPQMIAQYQDIVRSHLETMRDARAALHGQCRRRSVDPGSRGAGDARAIADIIQRLRGGCIVPRRDEVHRQTWHRLPCPADGPRRSPAVPHAAPGGNN